MSIHLQTVSYKAVLLSMVLGLLSFTIALALPGDLDTTFSGDGKVITNLGAGRHDIPNDIAIQPNGKIVVAGSSLSSTGDPDFALVRYNPNGSLDTTFSGDGRVTLNFGGSDGANGVAIQPDGKIIAAGTTCNSGCNVALARFNSNGVLDTTFSGDGKVITDFGGGDNDSSSEIVIQSDGKIVVAGGMFNGTDADFAVYRYNTNGSLDPTFSGDGRVRLSFEVGRQESASALAYQISDGKLVVSGSDGDGDFDNNDFAIARLNPNGTLDKTFSGDGKQITDLGGDDIAYGFAGLPDGRMAVVGRTLQGGLSRFAIARYNPNGSLDTTFNVIGIRAFSIISGKWAIAYDAVVQPDGKMIVGGYTDTSSNLTDFALVRLKPNGAFDTTFSVDGKVTVDFGDFDTPYALARQPSDGKYVLAGDTLIGTQPADFALARVLP